MPLYQFECQSCKHVHVIALKMSEYDAYSKVCAEDRESFGGLTPCGGELIQDYSDRGTQNFILLGGGWTPKHGPINRG